MVKNFFSTTFLLLISLFVSAKGFGPDVSVYRGEELKWENGAYGYHVMFKSLLSADSSSEGFLQANGCIDETIGSTYTLEFNHTPADAVVERAFLVWTGAVPLSLKDEPTDHRVTLTFISRDRQIKVEETIKGKNRYRVLEEESFEFDSFKDPDQPINSYFTYRVDITDFFDTIQKIGTVAHEKHSGYSLYGQYNLKNLKCADDITYVQRTTLVSGWSIIVVYTSGEVRPRNIYLYDSFSRHQIPFI